MDAPPGQASLAGDAGRQALPEHTCYSLTKCWWPRCALVAARRQRPAANPGNPSPRDAGTVSDTMPMPAERLPTGTRFDVLTDVHGCLDEFGDLLELMGYGRPKRRDRDPW